MALARRLAVSAQALPVDGAGAGAGEPRIRTARRCARRRTLQRARLTPSLIDLTNLKTPGPCGRPALPVSDKTPGMRGGRFGRIRQPVKSLVRGKFHGSLAA